MPKNGKEPDGRKAYQVLFDWLKNRNYPDRSFNPPNASPWNLPIRPTGMSGGQAPPMPDEGFMGPMPGPAPVVPPELQSQVSASTPPPGPAPGLAAAPASGAAPGMTPMPMPMPAAPEQTMAQMLQAGAPNMGGPQAGVLAPPGQTAPGQEEQGRPGFLSRLFGGPSAALLSPEQQEQAGSAAMMNAGLGMIESAGAGRRFGEFGPSTLASVAAGIRSGQETYAGRVGETMATQEAARAREEQAEMDVREDVFEQELQSFHSDNAQVEDYNRMAMEALRAGRPDYAANLSKQAEMVQQRQMQQAEIEGKPKYSVHTNSQTGTTTITNTVTGEERVIERPPPGQAYDVSDQIMIDNAVGNRFIGNTKYEQAAHQGFTQFEASLSAWEDYNKWQEMDPARQRLLQAQYDAGTDEMKQQMMDAGEAPQTVAPNPFAIIVSYVKSLDPTSVVKEGEYAAVTSRARGDLVLRRALAMIGEGKLPTELLQSMVTNVDRNIVGQAQNYYNLRGETLDWAKKSFKYNADHVLPDHYAMARERRPDLFGGIDYGTRAPRPREGAATPPTYQGLEHETMSGNQWEDIMNKYGSK